MLTFNNKTLKIWFFIGILFIFTMGSLLHFTYTLSGNNKIVALFSATNESVWEHLKLALFGTIFFSFIEYWMILGNVRNYFFGRLIGILSMMFFITIMFYTYTGILGHSILPIDISLFLIGAIINQFVSYKLMMNENLKNYNLYSFWGLLGLIFLFFIFTFYPPNLPLFMPSNE
ncbi:DUF6512 family protein [Clostridium frigidicarnis]|uniref:Uncharacterized protein n=1 Tax=Clostridium frigidicarnis TaxID=84698 RepID=A0A1I0Z9X2_9CLOT|nr:DUF6512 family protein [Clostridium frigidicarnis]SFB21926.1 hypothetical protein SAMN04488528_101849 [Clostridium frigidicarnis]